MGLECAKGTGLEFFWLKFSISQLIFLFILLLYNYFLVRVEELNSRAKDNYSLISNIHAPLCVFCTRTLTLNAVMIAPGRDYLYGLTHKFCTNGNKPFFFFFFKHRMNGS